MRIGIDLGGTKTEGIALADDGSELARRRIATPREDYPATVQAIAGLVAHLEETAGRPGTVGVGIPGTLSPSTGRVKNANSTWLNGERLDVDLAAALGREVRCANDANCLGLSEATDGAAAGAGVVLAVILGTGVGAGLVVGGRLLDGRNGVAGEWGHNPLPWPEQDEPRTRACWCGRHGCIETWLSGPALERDHRERTGAVLAAAEVAQAAVAGEAAASETLRRYSSRLARALAHAVNILDPDIVVLGGGLSNIAQLYLTVPPLLPRWVFGGEADTPLRRAQHGDSSGVRGAAWLWPGGDL